MRVTFLAVNYAPSVGGAQTHVRRLAEGLARDHGHEVCVLTTDTMFAPAGRDPGRLPPGWDRIGGVDVLRVPVARRLHGAVRRMRRIAARGGRKPRRSSLTVGPLGARLAAAVLREARRSDVVVGVAAPYSTITIGGALTRSVGTPFVALPLLHLGEWQPEEPLRRALRKADRCIANTSAERSWMVSVAGVPSERATDVPPGCDPVVAPMSLSDSRHALGLPDGPVVLMLGRLAPQKGIDTLFAAVPGLLRARPDTTVVLAGSRTGWSGLPAALAALGDDATSVVVREDFDESERAMLLAAADVVVMPSREESFGLVILEAWASKRPVVASHLLSIGSFVRDGVDGILVPPTDIDRWVASVISLIDDPQQASAMGAAGHERIAVEYDWSQIVERWQGELLAAVDGQHTRRRPQV